VNIWQTTRKDNRPSKLATWDWSELWRLDYSRDRLNRTDTNTRSR